MAEDDREELTGTEATMGQRTMGQRMPAQKDNPSQNDSDRRVVVSLVWLKDVDRGAAAA